MLLFPHQCEASKSPDILGWLVFSLRCFTVHTPSHVSSEVCTFMYPLAPVCQRFGPLVLHALQSWRKSLRKSFVMHLFERSTVWCSLLVLKISYSTDVDAHKSWSSWLWRHNTSPVSPFLKTIPVVFRCSTLGGNFWEQEIKVDGLPIKMVNLMGSQVYLSYWSFNFTF